MSKPKQETFIVIGNVDDHDRGDFENVEGKVFASVKDVHAVLIGASVYPLTEFMDEYNDDIFKQTETWMTHVLVESNPVNKTDTHNNEADVTL